jgi:hypothetical protein
VPIHVIILIFTESQEIQVIQTLPDVAEPQVAAKVGLNGFNSFDRLASSKSWVNLFVTLGGFLSNLVTKGKQRKSRPHLQCGTWLEQSERAGAAQYN